MTKIWVVLSGSYDIGEQINVKMDGQNRREFTRKMEVKNFSS